MQKLFYLSDSYFFLFLNFLLEHRRSYTPAGEPQHTGGFWSTSGTQTWPWGQHSLFTLPLLPPAAPVGGCSCLWGGAISTRLLVFLCLPTAQLLPPEKHGNILLISGETEFLAHCSSWISCLFLPICVLPRYSALASSVITSPLTGDVYLAQLCRRFA